MVLTLTTFLLLVGALCFFFAAIAVAPPRINLIALGLLCWILTVLIERGH